VALNPAQAQSLLGLFHPLSDAASEESGAFAFVMKENLTHDLPRLLELAASERGWNKPSKNCA